MSANFLTKDLVLWTAVYALLLERRLAPGLLARMRQHRYHDSFWSDEARRCGHAFIVGREGVIGDTSESDERNPIIATDPVH